MTKTKICPKRERRETFYDRKNYRDCPTINDAVAKAAGRALDIWWHIPDTVFLIENACIQRYEDKTDTFSSLQGTLTFDVCHLKVVRTGPTAKDYKIFSHGFSPANKEDFDIRIHMEVFLGRHHPTDIIMEVGPLFGRPWLRISKTVIDFCDNLHMEGYRHLDEIHELGEKRLKEAIDVFRAADFLGAVDALVRCPKCGREVRVAEFYADAGLCVRCWREFSSGNFFMDGYEEIEEYVQHHPVPARPEHRRE